MALGGTGSLLVDGREIPVGQPGQTHRYTSLTHLTVSAGGEELTLPALIAPALAQSHRQPESSVRGRRFRRSLTPEEEAGSAAGRTTQEPEEPVVGRKGEALAPLTGYGDHTEIIPAKRRQSG